MRGKPIAIDEKDCERYPSQWAPQHSPLKRIRCHWFSIGPTQTQLCFCENSFNWRHIYHCVRWSFSPATASNNVKEIITWIENLWIEMVLFYQSIPIFVFTFYRAWDRLDTFVIITEKERQMRHTKYQHFDVENARVERISVISAPSTAFFSVIEINTLITMVLGQRRSLEATPIVLRSKVGLVCTATFISVWYRNRLVSSSKAVVMWK